MTVMPGLRGVYDGWNRLVEARNASNMLIARYDYNGLNQRVRKTVGSTVTTSFFNQQWQELEAVTGGQTTVNIWGQRYIDDLVLRERGNERLYSLADPNWNVVAITNASGTVQERMRYDAFGRITWLDAAFATKANSDFGWNRAFTGQVLDNETGMMLYRNRFYHTGLGRFIQRDPIGYEAEDVSLYRYIANRPQFSTDPFGLILDCERQKKCCEDAKAHHPEPEKLVGKVICCDGEKTVCFYGIPGPNDQLEPNPDPRNNYAHWAKAVCLFVHEAVHVPQAVCTPGVEGYSEAGFNENNIPPLPHDDPRYLGDLSDRAECAAYIISRDCIRSLRPGCRGDKDCEESIDIEIERQREKVREFCFPRPRGQA